MNPNKELCESPFYTVKFTWNTTFASFESSYDFLTSRQQKLSKRACVKELSVVMFQPKQLGLNCL